jgi:hypothetical protein
LCIKMRAGARRSQNEKKAEKVALFRLNLLKLQT